MFFDNNISAGHTSLLQVSYVSAIPGKIRNGNTSECTPHFCGNILVGMSCAIWSPIRPPPLNQAPRLRSCMQRRTHLFSGFPRESTSKRTKMAVDLTVARRQLGEALGDFSQTYDHLFFLCLRKL